jgi:hypothetical protein
MQKISITQAGMSIVSNLQRRHILSSMLDMGCLKNLECCLAKRGLH